MRLINFKQIQKKYHLNPSKVFDLTRNAKFKKGTPGTNHVTQWRWDSVEIDMLVRALKIKLGKLEVENEQTK